MFCYAFALGLQAKGYQVFVDEYSYIPQERMTFEAVKMKAVFPDISFNPTPTGYFPYAFTKGIKGKLIRLYSNCLTKKKYIKDPSFSFIPDIDKYITEDCCFKGFWQSSGYFEHCRADVLHQFTFPPFDEAQNILCAQRMLQENAVAIHVRKGKDYQDDFLWKNTCPADYYHRAISYIQDHVDTPVFYVFTDNMDWVREHLTEIDYTVVDWNPIKGVKNYRDMQLMSMAKHQIIANSTYSWWAAYLNPHPDKIVTAPKIWFSPDAKRYRHHNVLPSGWIQL